MYPAASRQESIMNASAKNAQRAATITSDPRWSALTNRDATADGTFYYSVSTTGVYCRPSCAARLARPENVRFHASRMEAEQAGFRPCKRCKPDQPSQAQRHAAAVTEACRLLEAEETPSLDEIAARVGISAYYFHRIFRQVTGLTPRAYGEARREDRIRQRLAAQASVTEAIFDAGYQTNSSFYRKSAEILGMKPGRYRAGGMDTEIRFAVGESNFGSILVAQTERGICAILMSDDPDALARDLQDRFPRARLIGGDAAFEDLVARVVGFVQAPNIGLDLPLDVRGTAFQQRVWQALRDIPPGRTATYTEIADRIGAPNAVRAVASACAANPLAVAIPCHRVVRIDGGLAGYRWSVERKRALLDLEARGTLDEETRQD
jgi:AraC family transcriptional regulator of adaptative response/methylated-DNA-[protein]-cysteine methyltransferase